MKPRQQRMLAVGLAVVGLGIAAALTLTAFEENMMFFIDISEVAAGNAPEDRNFRVGGLVVRGQRRAGGRVARRQVHVVRLPTKTLDVYYAGVLPDLFREGQGIIAHGKLEESGAFRADTVLAKHRRDLHAAGSCGVAAKTRRGESRRVGRGRPMIPEIGHFASNPRPGAVALPRAYCRSLARIGAMHGLMAIARPASVAQLVFVTISFGVSCLQLFGERLQRRLRSQPFAARAAGDLQVFRGVGCARRFAGAVDPPDGGLDRGGRAV